MIKKQIPNILTLANLSCGGLAIILCFQGEMLQAAIFCGAGLVFDFFDGFVARLLKVSSPLGKELDSMADMVTFGVFPAVVMYHLMLDSSCQSGTCTGLVPRDYFPYTSVLLATFAGFRLANFNIDTRQSESFIGLPTPSMAMVVVSIGVLDYLDQVPYVWITHPKVLLALTLLLCYVMNADIELIALKFKSNKLKDNIWKIALVLSAVILLIAFGWMGIPLSILTYVLLSIIKNISSPQKI